MARSANAPAGLTRCRHFRSIVTGRRDSVQVLTGFNTDIEFEGVTYHVQTEDRRGANPLIESLVYVKGEILAARRTAYRNLLEAGAETSAVQVLMERQHFAIVEALRRGRIHLLTEPETSGEGDTTVSRSQRSVLAEPPPPRPSEGQARKTLDEVIAEWLAEQEKSEGIRLEVEGGDHLRFGGTFPLKVTVRSAPGGNPVAGAQVLVRLLSTARKPLELAAGESNEGGRVEASVAIPPLDRGTALVVVSAQYGSGSDEAKFLIQR